MLPEGVLEEPRRIDLEDAVLFVRDARSGALRSLGPANVLSGSRDLLAFGVPPGADNPNHATASNPG